MNKTLILKVICWRALSVVAGTLLSILLLGDVAQSIKITLIFTVVFSFLHYLFEIAWEKWVDKK